MAKTKSQKNEIPLAQHNNKIDEFDIIIDGAINDVSSVEKIIPKKPNRKKSVADNGDVVVFNPPNERRIFTLTEIVAKFNAKNKENGITQLEVSPVQALGKCGLDFYFLDADSQMIVLKAAAFNAQNITALFGTRCGLLDKYWPRYGADGSIKQWDTKDAYGSLMASCSSYGTIHPGDMVRGTGAWLYENKLILHTGKKIYHNKQVLAPSKIGDHVYPAEPIIVEPASKYCQIYSRKSAKDIFALLQTWNWERSTLDAFLLLGYIASSMVGGALKVRPLVWITGERGCGKSALTGGTEGLIPGLFNRRIVATANTTAAGLYQSIKHSSLPVAVDEIEAKADSKTTSAVIELARQSFSGGVVLRGGAEHSAFSFTAKCSFLFSSINIPPLMPQDISRMAILRLKPLKQVSNLEITDAQLYEMGQNMLSVWVNEFDDHWLNRLKIWRDALSNMGHENRACDQFGTLLAAADFALNEAMPTPQYVKTMTCDMKPAIFSETGSSVSDADSCFTHLMSQRLDLNKGGTRLTVNEYVTAAVYGDDHKKNTTGLTAKDALNELNRNGLSVLKENFDGTFVRSDKAIYGREETSCLAVARQGEIIKLFETSDWAGKAGASNPHTQALGRIEGATMSDNPIRFGGGVSRATLIPLKSTNFFSEFNETGA